MNGQAERMNVQRKINYQEVIIYLATSLIFLHRTKVIDRREVFKISRNYFKADAKAYTLKIGQAHEGQTRLFRY